MLSVLFLFFVFCFSIEKVFFWALYFKFLFLFFNSRPKTVYFPCRKYHLSDVVNTIFTKKHMFCSAQSYSLCAKISGPFCIFRCIGVCPDLESANLICPFNENAKISTKCRFYCGYFSQHYFAQCSI